MSNPFSAFGGYRRSNTSVPPSPSTPIPQQSPIPHPLGDDIPAAIGEPPNDPSAIDEPPNDPNDHVDFLAYSPISPRNSEDGKPNQKKTVTEKSRQDITKEEELVRSEDKAEKITAQLKADVDTFKNLGTKYGCQAQVLFHILDRLTKRIKQNFRKKDVFFFKLYKDFYQDRNLPSNDLDVEYQKRERANKIRYWFDQYPSVCKSLDTSDSEAICQNVTLALEGAKSILAVIQNMSIKVDAAHLDKINDLLNRNSKPEHRIAVVGLEKSGKSTLINSFIGYDLLPRALERCTLVTTEVVFSDTIQFGYVNITIVYRSSNNLNLFLNNAETNNNEEKEKILNLSKNSLNLPPQLVSGTLEEMKNFLKDAVANPDMQYTVETVRVEISKSVLETTASVTIVDTPGSDSKVKIHESITHEMIDKSDACLYVKPGIKPSETSQGMKIALKAQASDFSNEVKRLSDQSQSKVFVVLTMLDMLKTTEQISKAIELSTEELIRLGFKHENIIPASPLFNLLNKMNDCGYLDTTRNRDEINTLKAFKESTSFTGSSLKDGGNILDKKILQFISEDLPKVRAKEAKQLLNFTYRIISNVIRQLPKNVSDEDFEFQVKQGREQLIMASWQGKVKKAVTQGHAWLFSNVYNKKNMLQESWQLAFVNSISDDVTDESKPQFLKDLVRYQAVQIIVLDLVPVETRERKRLMKYHLSKVENACHVVSDMIYDILEKYTEELISQLDSQCPFDWVLHDIIPKNECFLQVNTLVFRVAYPLALSVIRWPLHTQERESTIKELHLVCPEISLEPTKTGF